MKCTRRDPPGGLVRDSGWNFWLSAACAMWECLPGDASWLQVIVVPSPAGTCASNSTHRAAWSSSLLHARRSCVYPSPKGSGPKSVMCCVLSITAPDKTKGVFLHVQMEEEPWACLHWSRQELIRTDLMMGAYNAPVKLGSAPLWSLLLATQVISFHGDLIRGLSKVCFCIYNLLLVVSGFFFYGSWG